MKKSITLALVILSVMVIFSGAVFGETCKGLPGESFFDVNQITAPSGIPVTVAKGFSADGKMAVLSFQFPDRAQLLVGTGNDMEVIEDYGVEDFFNPTVMTRSGAIVGYNIDGYNQLPSVMFIDGDDYSLYELTEYGGWITGAVSDRKGNVYVLVNENNSLQLFIVSKNGIVSQNELAEASLYSYYGDGGLYVDEQGGAIYLVSPTSFSFSSLYFQFLSIFELELNSLVQKDYYILGWDGSYLPTVDFGGIEGANLVGQYDSQPFVYSLTSRELKTYSLCNEYAVARGVVFGNWLTGQAGGSASLFFQNMEDNGKVVLDFQFDYFEVWPVSQDKIIVQADNSFFLLSLKNYVKH